MPVKVKICGIRADDALETAIEAGADCVGLVFYPPSPRFVSVSEARALADRAKGRIAIVAVLVDPADALLSEVLTAVRPDMVQLHGREAPERCEQIKTLGGKPIIKAVPLSSTEDIAVAERYRDAADLILFDAKPPTGTCPLPGGNGVAFDWTILASPPARPFILSGGLSVETVGRAIAMTHASFVDVSSGVESEPGVKDLGLIRAFVRAAKAPTAVKACA